MMMMIIIIILLRCLQFRPRLNCILPMNFAAFRNSTNFIFMSELSYIHFQLPSSNFVEC